MITSESQLTPGHELWHIYGHLSRRADKIQILGEVQTQVLEHSTYRYVDVLYNKDGAYPYQGRCYLGDVGIGVNHNRNRLFETQQEALAYWDSPECQEYRDRLAREDDDGYVDPYYEMVDALFGRD